MIGLSALKFGIEIKVTKVAQEEVGMLRSYLQHPAQHGVREKSASRLSGARLTNVEGDLHRDNLASLASLTGECIQVENEDSRNGVLDSTDLRRSEDHHLY